MGLKEWGKCISDCTRAVEIDPEYIKGYLRRGRAYLGMQMGSEARRDLQRVVQLREPLKAVNLKEEEEINRWLMEAR